MWNKLFVANFVFIGLLCSSYGFSNGDQPGTACDTGPQHDNVAPQGGRQPYQVRATDEQGHAISEYIPGERIKVKISGLNDGMPIAGFLLWASPASLNSDYCPVGSWQQGPDQKLVQCDLKADSTPCGNGGNAIGHSQVLNASHIEATLTIPLNITGAIVFRAHIVNNYTIFWNNIQSPEILQGNAPVNEVQTHVDSVEPSANITTEKTTKQKNETEVSSSTGTDRSNTTSHTSHENGYMTTLPASGETTMTDVSHASTTDGLKTTVFNESIISLETAGNNSFTTQQIHTHIITENFNESLSSLAPSNNSSISTALEGNSSSTATHLGVTTPEAYQNVTVEGIQEFSVTTIALNTTLNAIFRNSSNDTFDLEKLRTNVGSANEGSTVSLERNETTAVTAEGITTMAFNESAEKEANKSLAVTQETLTNITTASHIQVVSTLESFNDSLTITPTEANSSSIPINQDVTTPASHMSNTTDNNVNSTNSEVFGGGHLNTTENGILSEGPTMGIQENATTQEMNASTTTTDRNGKNHSFEETTQPILYNETNMENSSKGPYRITTESFTMPSKEISNDTSISNTTQPEHSHSNKTTNAMESQFTTLTAVDESTLAEQSHAFTTSQERSTTEQTDKTSSHDDQTTAIHTHEETTTTEKPTPSSTESPKKEESKVIEIKFKIEGDFDEIVKPNPDAAKDTIKKTMAKVLDIDEGRIKDIQLTKGSIEVAMTVESSNNDEELTAEKASSKVENFLQDNTLEINGHKTGRVIGSVTASRSTEAKAAGGDETSKVSLTTKVVLAVVFSLVGVAIIVAIIVIIMRQKKSHGFLMMRAARKEQDIPMRDINGRPVNGRNGFHNTAYQHA